MPDAAGNSAPDVQTRHVASLRHEIAEKSRQLSEMDVMLADYHAERAGLIRDLRRLQARLRDAEEPSQASPSQPTKQ
ncbi:MAG: hypothetical protein HY023_05370 [Chloroflexi bacterium]|nr:hypothetical protein [Chloroflexota bacterium]